MAKPASIPRPAIQRIAFYLRQLERFEREGVETISSAQLGEAIGASAAQVRKDLAYFGQFGQRGVGYTVQVLVRTLRAILSLNREWQVALIGAGNIGRALCTYRTFRERGFRIVALFDNDPRKEGCTWAGLKVRPMRELPRAVRELQINLGILAVPAESAQTVADQLVAAGVRGILSFAPAHVSAPPGVQVCSVDLAVELEQLAFLVASPSPEGSQGTA
jgi:redox-sensing transcriptional repressor